MPSDEATLQQWVRLSREGDEAAFGRLIGFFAPKLQALIYRILLDWDETRDVAQETFVRAYRALPSYEPRGKFQSWLFQIGARMALDELRKRKHRPELIDPAAAPMETGQDDPTVRRNEISAAIERAVAKLPPDLRTAFILSEYEEQGHADIARVIGGSAKSVEMKLYRARQALREELISYLE
ncbi:MAG: sigma-70 family RNA polymerase sigma factor [Verrucomicrobia bacterium]|nr:sigma-70 family RNA polymerase sigma factor [Verrucomicrobiota bacterium]